MSRAIVIYIGTCPKCVKATLSFPEERRLPTAVAILVMNHIMQDEKDVLIETYSEIPINLLGEMIERKMISHQNARIVLEDNRTFRYNEKGYIIDWCYGYFSPQMNSVLNKWPLDF